VKVGGASEDALREIENVFGGSANDTLTGDASANLFRGGGGKDLLNGAGGLDTADYSDKTAAVQVSLNGATQVGVKIAGVAEDAILNIENVIGGAANDTLVGDALANLFRGGSGKDLLDGGAGLDTADYSDKAAAVQATLNGAATVSVVIGGAAEDAIVNIESLFGGAANDTLVGDALANLFRGGGGKDLLNGAGGLDTADYSDKIAAVEVTLNGATQVGVKVGGVAEDAILNIENLTGGSAADSLTGDDRANVIDGGPGADGMAGGSASDTFAFRRGEANGDTVADFNGNGPALGDSLRFVGFGQGATFAQVDATHWRIDYDGGAAQEVVAFSNAPAIHQSDYAFI
jgi:Ca2+-binding RTX toxin-like protein